MAPTCSILQVVVAAMVVGGQSIAAAMGLKLSTYDRRMHRARATLRRFNVDLPA